MGSQTHCYHTALIEYIHQCARYSKYEEIFTDDYLYERTTEELEDIAKRFYKHHPMVAALNLGIALFLWGGIK